MLGNQPDRLPGCQHLRNAKPPLRQGWVLRAGCSARAGCSPGDSAGPPSCGVQGAAPSAPLGTAPRSPPSQCGGTLGQQVHGGAGWGAPGCGVLPGLAQLAGVLVGREALRCWEPEGTGAPIPVATHGGCLVLGPAPQIRRCWDGSQLTQDWDQHREGGQGWEVGAEPGSAPVSFSPCHQGAAGVVTPLLPPKCVPRATGMSRGSTSDGFVTWVGGTAGLPCHPCPPPPRRARGHP